MTALPKFDASNLLELDKIEAVLAAEQKRRSIENRLRYYKPYAKQLASLRAEKGVGPHDTLVEVTFTFA